MRLTSGFTECTPLLSNSDHAVITVNEHSSSVTYQDLQILTPPDEIELQIESSSTPERWVLIAKTVVDVALVFSLFGAIGSGAALGFTAGSTDGSEDMQTAGIVLIVSVVVCVAGLVLKPAISCVIERMKRVRNEAFLLGITSTRESIQASLHDPVTNEEALVQYFPLMSRKLISKLSYQQTRILYADEETRFKFLPSIRFLSPEQRRLWRTVLAIHEHSKEQFAELWNHADFQEQLECDSNLKDALITFLPQDLRALTVS